ncbi:methionyl-tRNA synthetase [Sporomusaceae bacterium BoRhaA]|uniref:methionine--tRNA ligase n=1 Tax=Pelorhabdus rhamnosifermentans TaxID=2772457 RepID=UPI001C060369|nr:methionine--tRNA ligase [Pelorhabdus rhamnosifermentans]MBU2702094.1 methionyl-tRNA synthetase [Pelorhabdus rhamnosifermentans]
MSKKPFYLTTPIFYPSDKLHIGHAYCTSVADTIARYKRLMDYDVLFLTGSDEHGQKIERKAQENGVTPIAYVDKIVASFQQLWKKLNISNDDFIRTTQERHRKVVQNIFQKIYDQGDIYKSAYKGWYCTPCETFWLERQLVDGKCPDCGRPVEVLEEESYFFRMSKYQDRLLKFIEENPEFIQPVTRRNEMINFIKGGLEDLCVSRTTFDWGIPVPFDSKHIVYVWFDALVNYITAAGYLDDREKYKKFWPADLHLVGKEIVRFHSIIWPVILMALGEPLPKQVFGHGWLIVEGDKMSKSKGNVIDPVALIDEFGPDAIRYFLLREINLGLDGNFSRQALINRINADLANDLGNLLHRTLSMVGRFRDGVIPAPGEKAAVDEELEELCNKTVKNYQATMDKYDITTTLKDVWVLISRTNKYIDETSPWALVKQVDQASRLDTVLYNLAETLRTIAVLLSPVMPTTAEKIWQQLGMPDDLWTVRICDITTFGGLKAGIKVNKPQQIFPRIEEREESESAESSTSVQETPKIETLPEVSIDEFAKLDLRVAKVLAAEKVAKADKLLKLEVDLGGEVRTIVSGIAKHYKPEELVGQSVLMIVNLKPAKIRGIESRGMVLAASIDDKLAVVTVPDMPAGSKVK